jgi:hypothetical protein
MKRHNLLGMLILAAIVLLVAAVVIPFPGAGNAWGQ